jgi:hypothetical protein
MAGIEYEYILRADGRIGLRVKKKKKNWFIISA